MRIILLSYCTLLLCLSSFSQNKTQREREIYKDYESYTHDSTHKKVCIVAKRKIENIYFLKVKSITGSLVDFWGISFEDKVWIKNKRKNKCYELKQDSLGLYYDLYNDDIGEVLLQAGGFLTFGIAGVLTTTGVSVYFQKSKKLFTNVVIRYRQDVNTKEFQPYSYPDLKKTKAIYYFSKYSKNENSVSINVEGKNILLRKGSYYEDVLVSRKTYSKKLTCLDEGVEPFDVIAKETETTVILFKRKKDGTLTYNQLNENMVLDFLKRKDKLEQVNP